MRAGSNWPYYRKSAFRIEFMVLYNIAALLLQVAFGLVAGVCLLRLYMQYQRIPMSARSGNALGPFIFALTDWLVLPLRKLLPPLGRWDTASLVAAFLLLVVEYGLLWLLAGARGAPVGIPVQALGGLVSLVLTGLSGLVIVYAVLSWVQAHSVMAAMVERLVDPLLRPIRRVVPLVGGIDLSPLVLLVLLQIAGMVLESARAALFL